MMKIMKVLYAPLLVLMVTGCASNDCLTSDSHHVDVSKISLVELSKAADNRLPASDWGVTKTTLYEPIIEMGDNPDEIMIKMKGTTVAFDKHRYKYSFWFSSKLEYYPLQKTVRFSPLSNIQWDLSNVPSMFHAEVIDQTSIIVRKVFSDDGLTPIEL